MATHHLEATILRPGPRLSAAWVLSIGVVGLIAWLIRDLAVRQRIQGDLPVTVGEVTGFLPTAASLRPDDSARDGLFVLDRAGLELGYVVRTQPR